MWVKDQSVPVRPLAPVCPVNPVRPAERESSYKGVLCVCRTSLEAGAGVGQGTKHTCEAAGSRLSGQPCEACRERAVIRTFSVSMRVLSA